MLPQIILISMKPIISAIRTLTILPVPGKDTNNFASAIPFFPVPALLLGLIPLGVYYLFQYFNITETALAALLSLFLTSYITGFLHVDGLGDVADAFGGGKSKEKILEILKDSRMGTFGIGAIFFDILFKLFLWEWAFRIGEPILILLSIVFARNAQMVLLNYSKSARNDGIAATFIKTSRLNNIMSLFSIFISIISFYFLISRVLLIISVFITILVILISSQYFNKKIGGITGDCLGTVSELVEISILFSFFITLNI